MWKKDVSHFIKHEFPVIPIAEAQTYEPRYCAKSCLFLIKDDGHIIAFYVIQAFWSFFLLV